jgi:D-erythrose 4-phosphate dehydrogenase
VALRIAINGFGRVGRCVLRAIYERSLQNDIEVVAINELADCETISYMLRYDSTHGRFPNDVAVSQDQLTIQSAGQQKQVKILHHEHITDLPWAELNIDVVLECTGEFKSKADLSLHLGQGAKKVLLSQPGESDVDYTLIAGVNDSGLTELDKIVSVGSCSTNCVLPVMQLIHDQFEIERGVSTTIHSAMNDQPVIDAYASDLRRTRAAVASIIPIDTALAKGISRIMPHLEGRMECVHLRVPTLNVSLMDLTLHLKKQARVVDINELLRDQASTHLNGLIGFTHEPHASVDFNHDSRSGIVDGSQTKVSDDHLLKLIIWFDNEWGFSNRMVDALLHKSINTD